MTEPPREVEAKLAAAAPEADAIASALATAATVGGLELGPPKRVALRDVYLDTPWLALAHWRGAMRIREKNGELLLTVKGPALDRSGPAISRPEFEAPLNQENADRAIEWVRGLMPDARDLPATVRVRMDPPGVDGFEVIHDRRNERVKRIMTTALGPVEVAIDRVAYQVDEVTITMIEIEVEALEGAGVEGVVAGVNAIVGEHPGLKAWRHSKLSVGLAMRQVVEGGLDGLVEGGVLTEEGLLRVDAVLSTSNPDGVGDV